MRMLRMSNRYAGDEKIEEHRLKHEGVGCADDDCNALMLLNCTSLIFLKKVAHSPIELQREGVLVYISSFVVWAWSRAEIIVC